MKRDLRRVWSMLLLGTISLSGAWVRAQEAAPAPETKPQESAPADPKPAEKPEEKPRSERRRNRSGADYARQWTDRFSRFRALDQHERDHESVRSAFRDVVNEPHKATVRVLSNDRAACLGCIVDSNGFIVTKASEVKGTISVKLHDNRLFEAKVVGVDLKNDVAMLKIEAKDLPAIAWRDANDIPTVGSFLATAGLETLPVAIGVVSVQPRTIAGPRAVMGVRITEQEGPPQVYQVDAGFGADKAGVKVGDTIIAVNDQALANFEALRQTVSQFEPGDKVTLKIKRGNEELQLDVRLQAQPTSPESDRKDFQNALGGPLSERRQGFRLALQHDTVLTPQECGGPLVDLDGRAVGINIARAGRVNSYALPTSVMLPLVEELKSGKFALDTPADSSKLSLTRRWEELKQSENNLGMKLTQLLSNIQKLQESTNADELKKVEQEKAATESELGKIKAELEKIQLEKTSLEK